jgi:hypothetical protein
LPVSKACLKGQANFFRLVQGEREKPEDERNHQSDAASGEERKRLQNPDKGILKFPGTGNGCEEDRIAEEKGQPEEGERCKTKSLRAHGNPRNPGNWGSRGEKDLKKKEKEEEDRPAPKTVKEGFERQAGEKEKAKEKNRIENEPFDSYSYKRCRDCQKAKEFASRIPAMKKGISRKIVKHYPLSHETFSLPRIV